MQAKRVSHEVQIEFSNGACTNLNLHNICLYILSLFPKTKASNFVHV